MEQQILDEAIALSDARYDELQRLTRRIAELEALLTAPETYYYVEARFIGKEDWLRNAEKHYTVDSAQTTARCFSKRIETRIIKVTETIVAEAKP